MIFFGQKKQSTPIPTEKLIFGIHEINLESVPLVGDKVVGVARLARTDVPVPAGFVLSTRFYDFFLNETGIHEVIKKAIETLMVNKSSDQHLRKFSSEIQEKIAKAKFPIYLVEEVKKAYSRLSGFSDSWVAVRSSFPSDLIDDEVLVGKLFTELNVKSLDDLLEAIKKAYSSLFSLGFVEYLISRNLNPASIQMAVFIQKMVQAEVSGVMFTLDPVTNNKDLLSIEAVFGLGDTISQGALTPDQYFVQKGRYQIVDRRIVPQEWMHILRADKKTLQDSKVRISSSWQNKPKLEDQKIVELAQIGAFIESFMKRPQDIEWVMENGRFWIVQTRDVTKLDADMIIKASATNIHERNLIEKIEAGANALSSYSAEQLEEETVLDHMTFGIEKTLPSVKKKKIKNKLKNPDWLRTKVETSLNLLMSGVSAGNGIVSGPVNIVFNEKDRDSIKPGQIVAIKGDNLDWIFNVPDIAAIITDFGGTTSDVAINARTRGLPCVVDTQIGTKLLRQGEILTVDGATGRIYEGSVNVAVTPKKLKTQPAVVAVAAPAKTKSEKQETDQKTEKTPVLLEKTVMMDGAEVKIQDVKILTATKTLLDISQITDLTGKDALPFSIVDGVGHFSGNLLFQALGKHPLTYIEDKTQPAFFEKALEMTKFFAEKVNPDMFVYHLSDLSREEYRELSRGKTMEMMLDDKIKYPHARGVERHLLVPSLLKLELEIIKRLRNKLGIKNVSLAISYVRSNEQLSEIKKEISALGLRRSKTFNILLSPTVPSNIFEINKLIDNGIDGLVIDPNKLISAIIGVEVGTGGSLIDRYMSTDTVRETFQEVFKKVAKAKQKIYVKLDESEMKSLGDFLEWGVTGVVVHGSQMSLFQREIRDLENKLVMKKMRKR